MTEPTTITVAIPTCNRASVLRRALECLTSQVTDEKFDYQIVVVDNGSVDNTREMVQSLDAGSARSLRHVIEPQRGIPFVRNMAIKECDSPWLAFFDDDQLTSPDWLKTLYDTALIQKSRFVGGSRDLLIEECQVAPLSSVSRMLLGEMLKPDPEYYHAKFLPSTGNVLIERSVFDEVGGFDPNVLDGGEDSDFFNRLIQNKIPGYYNPRALVHHLIPPARIDPDYLRWIAFRHGIHLARRDVRHRGKLATCYFNTLRIGQAMTVFLPNKAVALLTKNNPEVIGWDCRLSKVSGFTTYLLSELFPSESSRRRLHDRSMHSGKR